MRKVIRLRGLRYKRPPRTRGPVMNYPTILTPDESTIVHPGETPWQDIGDPIERDRARNRQTNRRLHPSDFIVLPSETPWWELDNIHERTRAYVRQRKRVVNASTLSQNLKHNKNGAKNRKHSITRHGVCPVCLVFHATTTHHIIPRSEGGLSCSKNKVRLCPGCHDIVEAVYDKTGEAYSPQLALRIRLVLWGLFNTTGTNRLQTIVSLAFLKASHGNVGNIERSKLRVNHKNYVTPHAL